MMTTTGQAVMASMVPMVGLWRRSPLWGSLALLALLAPLLRWARVQIQYLREAPFVQ